MNHLYQIETFNGAKYYAVAFNTEEATRKLQNHFRYNPLPPANKLPDLHAGEQGREIINVRQWSSHVLV